VLLGSKFNEDFKNVLKTDIFLLQMSFTGDFVPDGPFKLCIWQLKLWHRFSPWLYQIFVIFFMFLDRKINENSKNVLKLVIFSLQVGFIRNFAPDCIYKLCFCQFKFRHRFPHWLYQIL